MLFPERLSYLIDIQPKNQAEIAKELGISPSNLSQYIHGTRQPDLNTLLSLSDYFDVSCDYLIGKQNIFNNKPISDKTDTLIMLFEKHSQEHQDYIIRMTEYLSLIDYKKKP